MSNGWNNDMESEAINPQFSHMSYDDAMDDDGPGNVAFPTFSKGVRQYNTLVQRMQQVWCGLLFIALCLSITLRIEYVDPIHNSWLQWAC